MKKAQFLFSVMLLLVISCKNEPSILPASCVEQYLAAHQLTKYEGQDLGCKTWVALYELDSKEYFHSENNCADMLSIPLDCEGNPYSSNVNSPEMTYFFSNAEFKGIVGF